MKLRKVLAMAAASALAVSSLAVSAFAVDAIGTDGQVIIAFNSGDWLASYFADGKEYASSMVTSPTITADGQYTATVKAVTSYEDEETGETATTDGTVGLNFAAVQVVNGETLFPGMVLTLDSVKFDGTEAALSGTGFTSSDDKATTRINLYNSWVTTIPDDARTAVDGTLAADATATPLTVEADFAWTEMEVTFTVTGTGVEATDDTDDTDTDDTDTDTDAGDTDADDTDDKGNADTGVEGVAAVAGLAIVATGAIVVAKKRK